MGTKVKNIGLVDLDNYCHELISVFSPDKFQKLSRNPCEVKKNIIQPFLSIDNFRMIKPYHSMKIGHVLLKVHKA